MSPRLALRIWLPDLPGRLAAVTSVIAEAGGNVLGLEVLERSNGVAVDELMVEVDRLDRIDDMSRAIQAVDGAGVEDVRQVPSDAEERGLQVIAAAIDILETANPTATLSRLSGVVGELFDADWTALVDLGARVCVESRGEVPPVDWLFAFCLGAAASEGCTSGSGVMAGILADANLSVCVGRAFAFRRREQCELDMLARVADRMCRPLRVDRIPHGWSSGERWPGG